MLKFVRVFLVVAFSLFIMSNVAKAIQKLKSVDYEIFGRVQGVCFRMYAEDQGRKLGVAGWVKNTRQGTVTGQVQGPEDKVDSMTSSFHHPGGHSCPSAMWRQRGRDPHLPAIATRAMPGVGVYPVWLMWGHHHPNRYQDDQGVMWTVVRHFVEFQRFPFILLRALTEEEEAAGQ
ncbi:uncharacterized protein LOC102346834 isoform X2 [Latimeria chalumnae]|uniref:uncharacterized protein LOC102346834 isoform X2 n=1 Tax=Latimeria chalumnae TaxID=7897 RepID=UPI00313F0647